MKFYFKGMQENEFFFSIEKNLYNKYRKQSKEILNLDLIISLDT